MPKNQNPSSLILPKPIFHYSFSITIANILKANLNYSKINQEQTLPGPKLHCLMRKRQILSKQRLLKSTARRQKHKNRIF